MTTYNEEIQKNKEKIETAFKDKKITESKYIEFNLLLSICQILCEVIHKY